jgi:hypothetical protein
MAGAGSLPRIDDQPSINPRRNLFWGTSSKPMEPGEGIEPTSTTNEVVALALSYPGEVAVINGASGQSQRGKAVLRRTRGALAGHALCGRLLLCFQLRQPRLGVGDKLSQPGLGARVFRKSKNRPHPHDAVAEPRYLVFDFFGHDMVSSALMTKPRLRSATPKARADGIEPGRRLVRHRSVMMRRASTTATVTYRTGAARVKR